MGIDMRARAFAVLAMILATGAAAGAAAVDNPFGGGTRLTGPQPAEIPTGAVSEQDKARIVGLRFAACMIKARRKAVAEAIASKPWDTDAGRKLTRAADPRCLEYGELAMPGKLLRGAFYQILYREKYSSGPPKLPEVAIDFTDGDQGTLTDDAKTDIALRQFGDCVARRDIWNAHLLVISTPGSSNETWAVEELTPDFSACVVQGAKWTLNRSTVAAILSEVLYREGAVAQASAGK